MARYGPALTSWVWRRSQKPRPPFGQNSISPIIPEQQRSAPEGAPLLAQTPEVSPMQLEDIILNVRVGRHLTKKQEDTLLQFARGYDAPEAWRAIYRPMPMVERVIPVDDHPGMWLLQLTCKHGTLAHGSAEAVV